MLAAVPAMVLVVLTILMFQMQSFQRVALVLSVAPLGLIGRGGLPPAEAPLGFVAILGGLALGGTIARNSVILIDQIEHERAAGPHPWDAVVTAAIHRNRPILLTASAATLGIIPIAPTVFWGPMAFAIIGGLTRACTDPDFLPALDVAWFRITYPSRLEGTEGAENTPWYVPRLTARAELDQKGAHQTWPKHETTDAGWVAVLNAGLSQLCGLLGVSRYFIGYT